MDADQTFIDLCLRLTAECDAEKIDIMTAATEINAWVNENSFVSHTHPMLYKISHLAWDIVEDYQSANDNKIDWDIITKTAMRYSRGDWEETCWILTIMYGEYDHDTLVHSFSIAITRQNGKTAITTANKALGKAYVSIISKVNHNQTDQRYLQNLLQFLPRNHDSFQLLNHTLQEYLTEPYYSTTAET